MTTTMTRERAAFVWPARVQQLLLLALHAALSVVLSVSLFARQLRAKIVVADAAAAPLHCLRQNWYLECWEWCLKNLR